MSLNLQRPHSVLFWRGPLHNEVRWINGYNVLIPIEPPMATILESPMMPALEVIEYTTQVFAWFWKRELREGVVMVPGYRDNSAANIEVESVMRFLEHLWGKDE